jgi:hypothetical protein
MRKNKARATGRLFYKQNSAYKLIQTLFSKINLSYAFSGLKLLTVLPALHISESRNSANSTSNFSR